jgi:maleylacetoacetate isomerase/maleylpyruvate isomerase
VPPIDPDRPAGTAERDEVAWHHARHTAATQRIVLCLAVIHPGRSTMQLYNYFRSSASFRVRIALALKGLPYDYLGVHLQRNEQLSADYAQRNPQKLVPLLVDGEHSLSQSLAIIEYLDEIHPEPPLLPPDALGRARVRSLALDIACEIHPLNNLRVLRYLVKDLAVSDDAKNGWYRHWVETGLAAFEQRLVADRAGGGPAGPYCHGATPTLADCTLVPQIFNAQRFKCSLAEVPTVMQVFEACMALPAFQAATPARCPDNEP